ncbi:hypothetical protein KJ870_10775 [bacterium]|nr:hypothetical protein [bacterium]MBU1435412.1 hypothetical protein [bacterium]MBU1502277.1 hypothetical protein [bacterium]
MRRIVLSTIAALAVGATSLSAAQQFYVDENGQVFTTSAPDRIAIENKETPVFIKGVKLEFSGTHYFGLTSANPATVEGDTGLDKSKYPEASTGFEMRRNYVQVKAFFNDKDYFRVTLDATKELAHNETATDKNGDTVTIPRNGYANAFVKYAYLYLDEVLPFTGVEIGIVHRPWIDYEEHNAWHYRSFNKVMLEEKGTATEAGVDLVNSADLGFNLKTKTEFFSSEIGLFNGEGYHADKDAANQENSGDLSLEWRLTGHLLGDGKKVGKNDRTKATYAHISTYGLISKNHKDADDALNQVSSSALKSEYDRSFYGLHAVYNQPEFLIAAQYAIAKDDAQDDVATATNWAKRDYNVWSINGEYRPIKDWTVIGRYDNYTMDDVNMAGDDMSSSVAGSKIIAGLAYKYSKNVSFIGSGKFIDEESTVGTQDGYDTGESKNVYMLTTEVKW